MDSWIQQEEAVNRIKGRELILQDMILIYTKTLADRAFKQESLEHYYKSAELLWHWLTYSGFRLSCGNVFYMLPVSILRILEKADNESLPSNSLSLLLQTPRLTKKFSLIQGLFITSIINVNICTEVNCPKKC